MEIALSYTALIALLASSWAAVRTLRGGAIRWFRLARRRDNVSTARLGSRGAAADRVELANTNGGVD